MSSFGDKGRTVAVFCVVLTLLFGIVSVIALNPANTDSMQTRIRSPILAGPSRPAKLGFDCGVGSTAAVVNGTGFPVASSENGQFQLLSNCFWIGDIAESGLGAPNGTRDMLRTLEPLVTDQDENYSLVSNKIGGGFTADINLLQNGTTTSSINAFDLTVSWNPNVLHAVAIDQGGLFWNTLGAFSPAPATIDNTLGSAHVIQLVTGGPTGTNVTLFRIRFDIITVGDSSLSVNTTPGAPCGICNPTPVAFQTKSLTFDTETFFDPSHSLNWSASWTFSDTLGPGSPVTFTATASCPGCTLPLRFRWDVNSDGITDASTNPATITLPNPGLLATRVTLTILDAAPPLSNHNVTVVRNLPLTGVVRPMTTSLTLAQGGTWNATWFGGIPSYHGTWRFCPGAAAANSVCVNPLVTIPSIASQTLLRTLNPVNSTAGAFHFAGGYNASVTLTDAGSPVIPTPNTVKFYFLVNVTGGPAVYTISLSSNSALNATTGQSVTFTAAITYNSAYPPGFRANTFNYRFLFGDGAIGTLTGVVGLTTTITHTYNSAGNYNVEVVPSEASAVATAKIEETAFLPLPVASPLSFTFTSTPSQSSSQMIQFSATAAGGTPPYTYAWSFGDGSNGTGATPSHTYSTGGNYTVTVTITDASSRTTTLARSVSVVTSPNSGTPWLFYGGIAAVLVIAGVLGMYALRKRRRPQLPKL